MKFGEDWTGVFIRGDNAMMYYLPALLNIKLAYERGEIKLQFMDFVAINNLINLSSQSNEFVEKQQEQVLKEFKDCELPKV